MSIFAEAVLATSDSNTQLRWNMSSRYEVVARFSLAQALVTTTFERTEGSEWRGRFDVEPGNSLRITMAIRVFSGVFQAVREFLEVRQPEKLMFSNELWDLANLFETYLLKADTTLRRMGFRIKT